jgi:type I restriction enzyme S subunit
MSIGGWEKCKIGELCESVSITHKSKKGQLIFLNTGDIERGKFLHRVYSDVSRMPGQAKKSIKKGDILFSEIRPANGRYALVDFDAEDYIVSTKLMVIRCSEKIIPKYFYQFITRKQTTDWLQHFAESRSGTFPQITFDQVADIEINLPDLPTQTRIAAFLSALDDKIELNRQTDATLEAIAQAIFKEWFVDFRFPGTTCEMQDSELGPIPKGWKVKKIEDVVNIKHGFAFKGVNFSEEATDEILITPGNFKIGGGFNYSKFKYYEGVYPSEYLLNRGDLIVTMTDLSKQGDTLGYPALVPQLSGKKLLHNQRIGKVELNKNVILRLYLYFIMRQNNYRNHVLSSATGTTVKHTSPGRVCDFTLVIPTDKVLSKFGDVIQGLIDNIEFSFLQNHVLAQTRDNLLPKLMSGEIEV